MTPQVKPADVNYQGAGLPLRFEDRSPSAALW